MKVLYTAEIGKCLPFILYLSSYPAVQYQDKIEIARSNIERKKEYTQMKRIVLTIAVLAISSTTLTAASPLNDSE